MKRRARVPTLFLAVVAPALTVTAVPTAGQDPNILIPVDSLEYLLAEAPFELPDTLIGTRFPDDRTHRVPLWFDDGNVGVLVKWGRAPRGGETFNNVPRYEIAAYELQKLFLSVPEYVVPPTVLRMIPVDWYRTVEDDVEPTFEGSRSVLVVLQYFLFNVTQENVFDEDLFEADSVYARHWANVNLLTHFIDHKDQNPGNLLVSTVPDRRRVFAVDNGIAFGSRESDRGDRWSDLLVYRFPRATAERLTALTEEEVRTALGVIVQYDPGDGGLVRVEPGENWDPSEGLRERDGGVQIGLTENEIDDVWRLIERFANRVRDGGVELF